MRPKNLFVRQFTLDSIAQVILSFDYPVLEDGRWRCKHEIVWPDGKERIFVGQGFDELSAFLNSLLIAESYLIGRKEYKEKRLRLGESFDLMLSARLE
jgi:hypothetical protein